MAEHDPTPAVRVRVPGRSAGEYPVYVSRDLGGRAEALLRTHAPAHRYALITDTTVLALHADSMAERLRDAGMTVDVFAFPAGEPSKTRATWTGVSDAMLAAGLGRDSVVLAVGGGVVGDLAGFVAATYLRGVPYVQIPTTLLAMIDSSVGGKTGVDTPAGKNLIGAFHAPRAVIASLDVLGTLPRVELRAGMAEAVKHGAIADVGYFSWMETCGAAVLAGDRVETERLVRRSVEIKAAAVAEDEREAGRRRTLNFGHTIGHAVEALSGYELLHGEAIAIGMVAEARLGERLGITAAGTAVRIRVLLEVMGLPTGMPAWAEPERVLELTRADKKSRGGTVEYALIEQLGRPHAGADARWSTPVPDELVREVLRDG
jgi:3-dehydroquinate synthase